MVTIDNYCFICIGKNRKKLAKPNEINDPRRKIIVMGTIIGDQKDKEIQTIEVHKYEKTYIIGSDNTTYYLGKKSKDMRLFEKSVRENIPVITNFKIGYAYNPKNNWRHIPCIIGKVENSREEKIIFVESQSFEENTVTDTNGQKYFIDWLSMLPYQYQKLTKELPDIPMKLKKYFGVFGEKNLKIDMVSLNDSLPILGIAGAFEIE